MVAAFYPLFPCSVLALLCGYWPLELQVDGVGFGTRIYEIDVCGQRRKVSDSSAAI